MKYYIEKVGKLVTDFEDQFKGLSQYRQHAVNSRKMQTNKINTLAVSLLLDRALAEYGLSEAEMKYAEGEHGKPYFTNRNDIKFSLSHSGEYVGVAISEDEIGIDIEKIKKIDLKIAKRFFTDNEYALIRNENDFFRLWTIKESFIKTIGKGLACPLNSFNIEDLYNNPYVIYNNKKYSFICGELDGYKYAICKED